MNLDQILADLERNGRDLDSKERPLYQGLLYLVRVQLETLDQLGSTQTTFQADIRELQEKITRLSTQFERFGAIEQQTQDNTEALSRIRGMIWAAAVFTPPTAAIIGGIIAALGPKLLG